ncbi:MAG: fibronectin type III domain-containing protein [Anaerolineales bacterium]|nr:fibronectin type III domain-containing protein [Anaerolineales bacterium]
MKSILRFLAAPVFFLVLCVTLIGCGGGGDGGGSSTPTGLPSAPTGVTATAGNAKATINWNNVSGATSYNIYYATSAGVTKTTGAKVANASSPYDVTGLTNGTTYFFVVTAVNSAGESDVSAEKSAVPTSGAPPPAAPKGLSATPGNNQVTTTWTAVTEATSYNVYYSTSAGVTKLNGTKVANAVSPKAITGLTNGTTYYFVVTAVNAAGESVESSETSAAPSAVLQPPASPNGVSVTGGAGKVTVGWNTKLTATSYVIYYSESSSTTSAALLATGTKVTVAALSADPQPGTQSHDVTGLKANTSYAFVVTSKNAAGESGTQNFPKFAVTSP